MQIICAIAYCSGQLSKLRYTSVLYIHTLHEGVWGASLHDYAVVCTDDHTPSLLAPWPMTMPLFMLTLWALDV